MLSLAISGLDLEIYKPQSVSTDKWTQIRFKLKKAGLFRWKPARKALVCSYTTDASLEAGLLLLIEEFPDLSILDKSTLSKVAQVKGKDLLRERRVTFLEDLRAGKEINLEGYTFNEYRPYHHQALALTYLNPSITNYSSVLALFADCGTGKTFIAIHWIHRIKKIYESRGKPFKAVVIGPLNTLYSAWAIDIHKFVPELKHIIVSGSISRKRNILRKSFKQKNKNQDYDVYLMTPRSFIQKKRAKAAEGEEPVGLFKDVLDLKPDLVIIDESSMMKDVSSSTTKSLITLSDSGPMYKMVMSGTPAPNTPLEYFGQIRFLGPRAFGFNFVHYRESYFIPYGYGGFNYRFNEIMKPIFLKKLHSTALRFKEEDCQDLPPLIDHEIKVVLDEDSWNQYTIFLKKAFMAIEKKTGFTFVPDNTWVDPKEVSVIVPKNILDMLLKAREITSGFFQSDKIIAKTHGHKFKGLKTLLDEVAVKQGKDETSDPIKLQAVIWGWFRYELKVIKKLLGDEAALIIGGLDGKKVAALLKDFQSGRYRYLITHPQCLGHGVRLCEQLPGNNYPQVSRNIYFSLNYSAELYQQSRKRIHRHGQKLPVHNYHLLAVSPDGKPSIDGEILNVLTGKYSTQQEFLDAMLSQVTVKKGEQV